MATTRHDAPIGATTTFTSGSGPWRVTTRAHDNASVEYWATRSADRGPPSSVATSSAVRRSSSRRASPPRCSTRTTAGWPPSTRPPPGCRPVRPSPTRAPPARRRRRAAGGTRPPVRRARRKPPPARWRSTSGAPGAALSPVNGSSPGSCSTTATTFPPSSFSIEKPVMAGSCDRRRLHFPTSGNSSRPVSSRRRYEVAWSPCCSAGQEGLERLGRRRPRGRRLTRLRGRGRRGSGPGGR